MNWRESLFSSPLSILGFILLLILSSQALAIYLLLQQPWTGLHIEPDPVSGFVKVISIDKNSPAEGLIPDGIILINISDANVNFPLTTKLYIMPFLHGTYEKYQAILDQQAAIYEILNAEKKVSFTSIDKKNYTLTPQRNKSILRISIDFWVFCMIFLIVVLLITLVWLYKSKIEATFFLFLACMSSYFFHLVGLVNFSKEFFFDRNITYSLFTMEIVFLNIYIPMFFFTTALYPRRLVSIFWCIVFYLVFIFYSVNFYFSWIAVPEWYLAFQAIVPFLAGVIVSLMQVKKSYKQPLEKVASSLVFFSMILPFIPIIFLHILPIYFNQEPLIDNQTIQLLGLTSFVGIALGIIRFRLFQFEYWWFKIGYWLFIGFLIVVVDIILIGLLRQSQLYALGLSVLLVGFVYFPLRQWLLMRFMPLDNLSLQEFLPRFSQDLIQAGASEQRLEQVWKEILQARFNPNHLTRSSLKITKPQLVDNGLGLYVPSLQKKGCYHLTGKQWAARLFNKADIGATVALWEVVQMTQEAAEACEQAIALERTYWLKELNATIGKKLHSLLDELELADPLSKYSTQDAIDTLEQTIQVSLQNQVFNLERHVENWQTEFQKRLVNHNIKVTWSIDVQLKDLKLSVLQAIELSQFLREALTNALKHAKPENILIDFKKITGKLCLKISHDGAFKAPETWKVGNGLPSLRARINTLQGEIDFYIDTRTAYLCLNVYLPLLFNDG